MAKTLDLRTYLLLERSFIRRLQRSWRAQSASTYAAITQACLDHNYDEARRLVPDLDMAEVGTTNREWITYMLRSFAVFGAGTVAKKKPSFVGAGSFDTFLKQVTTTFLQHLEHGATSQVQADALHLIAQDEAAAELKVAYDPNQARDKDGKWTKGGVSVVVDGEPIGLAAEARKAGSFEEFERDYIHDIKHGIYWHVTADPNFTLDPLKGPRDMSSMVGGDRFTPGALMVTSHLELWDEYYNTDPETEEPKITRPYAVLVDMSGVPRKDYHQISRGFGNELFVPDSSKAKVLAVVPMKTALALDATHQAAIPQSQKELRAFYNRAIATKWDPNQPRDDQGQWTETGVSIPDATPAGDEPAPNWQTLQPPPKKGDSLVVFRVGRASGGLTGRNAANAEGIASHLLNHAEYGADPLGDTLTAYRVTLTEDMQDSGYIAMQEGEAKPGQEGPSDEAVGRGTYFFGRGYTFPASGKGFTAVPIGSMPVAEIALGSPLSMSEQIRARFTTKKWDESQHPRDKEGQFTKSENHAELVQGAMLVWQGSPGNINPHIYDALMDAPQPSSGGGKERRAQAEALLWELEHKAIPIPKPLYRGSGPEGDRPGWIYSWTENRAIAHRFARMYGGRVETLPAGAKGLRMQDYVGEAQNEKHWLVRAGNDPRRQKWDESKHPRDKEGQFTEAVGRALIKAGRTTTDPNFTAFLLPDGTRVTAAGYNSHAKLAAAAGYNDLNKVIESGIVRYIPGVGVEANHLTEIQARIIVDDWEAYFAGPHGWNALQVDLVGREDRRGFGLEALSHRFERLSVDALLNFVNGIRKWDESKHPRDKEGQFTEAGGGTPTLAPVLDIEGGGGPARAEWKRLLAVSSAADDAYFEARAKHHPNAVIAQRAMRELATLHPDSTVEELERAARLAAPGWEATKAATSAAKKVMEEAEQAFKAQGPPMRIEVVTNLATQVAQDMGVPAHKIDVVDKNPREFSVGEKVFTEGGHYDPSDERIEVNVRNMDLTDAPTIKGLVAHELSHYVYHAAKRVAEREFQAYLRKAIAYGGQDYTPWYHERFEPVDIKGNPDARGVFKKVKPQYREEIAKEFPAATVMAELAGGDIFTGLSDDMIAENGHSAYAKSYWTPEAIQAKGGYESAINETMAEITRYVTNPRSWDEQTIPSPVSPWVKLTKAMHQWYTERQARIAAAAKASQVRT